MTEKTSPLAQPLANRESGADAACAVTEVTSPAAINAKASLASMAASAAHMDAQVTQGCLQRITIAFFFDGTGNNLDADVSTSEHSNVARLFKAHPKDDEVAQVYARYVPGLGTYFKEIKDPGGTTSGKAFGAWGQERLTWAFKELSQILQKAEARANNPSNKIVEVRISVFGFSRGAALARAFCRDLLKTTNKQHGQFIVGAGPLSISPIVLKGGYPIEVYFLGLFDTVASVGLPLSTNNFLIKRRNGLSWRSGREVVPAASTFYSTIGEAERDLRILAFGTPGADPSPGPVDGHGAWAYDLRIAEIVTRCVHMVAGHEMRNSFPLDSALDGNRYPDGTIEMVYPGVHSDVGGGYRQGEGGKSSMLSRVPLRAMLEKAIESKVPLRSIDQLITADQQKDFATDEENAKAYDALGALWQKYVNLIGSPKPLGATVLDHMRLYWKYRLTVARQRTDLKRASGPRQHGRLLTPDQMEIDKNEKVFSADREKLQKDLDNKVRARRLASTRRARAEDALRAAQLSSAFDNQVPRWQALVEVEKSKERDAEDQYLAAKAKLDTSANDSELISNTDKYDAWLLEDAALISQWHKDSPHERMRPHYQALAEAFDEVVAKNRPMDVLSDTYQFFSLYVHDSLSAFSQDNTRTSDPRVIYIAGDAKYRYAVNESEQEQKIAQA